jgi:hypothetical protein
MLDGFMISAAKFFGKEGCKTVVKRLTNIN